MDIALYSGTKGTVFTKICYPKLSWSNGKYSCCFPVVRSQRKKRVQLMTWVPGFTHRRILTLYYSISSHTLWVCTEFQFRFCSTALSLSSIANITLITPLRWFITLMSLLVHVAVFACLKFVLLFGHNSDPPVDYHWLSLIFLSPVYWWKHLD